MLVPATTLTRCTACPNSPRSIDSLFAYPSGMSWRYFGNSPSISLVTRRFLPTWQTAWASPALMVTSVTPEAPRCRPSSTSALPGTIISPSGGPSLSATSRRARR